MCYNPFPNIPLFHVAFKDAYDADGIFEMDDIFKKDGRNIGISTCCVFTTKDTHHLWKPIDIEKATKSIIQERKNVDEYTLSRNLAKYNMKYTAPYPIEQYNLMFHIGLYQEDKNKTLDAAKLWHRLYWK